MQELLAARTLTSKTYDLGNGQRQWSAAIAHIHYKRNGNLVDIQPRLEDDPDGPGFSHRIRGHPLRVRMASDGKRRIYFRDANGDLMFDKWLEIGGFPAIGAPDRRENGCFYWDQAGFDLMIGARGPALQKLLTLRNANIPTSWTFDVDLHGLQLDRSQVPWLIKDGNRVLAQLTRPYVIASNRISLVRPNKHWLDATLQAGKLTLSFDPTGLQYPLLVDPTFNPQIGATADDGFSLVGDQFITENANIAIGNVDSTLNCFLRFTNITIPRGSHINTAAATFTSTSNLANITIRTNIACNDDDNATAPTDLATHAAKARTTAQTTWDFATAWTTDTEYTTPDFAAAVQEVLDRGGWASGNAIMILIDDDGSDADTLREPYDYTDTPAKSTKLTITYTPPPARAMNYYRRRRT